MSHNKAKREANERRAETGEPYARAHRIAREQALQPSPVDAAVSVLDEAARLHRDAGVDYHSAHDAYIYAVADTVKAMGIEISEVTADGGEPREGWFRLGPPMEELWDDETGYGPSRVVGWSEDRGWHYVYFSDSQKGGDWVEDLPGGGLGLTARPENVAVAVARLAGELPRAPLPWALPGDYDEYPDLPGDEDEVSVPLERSLLAWTGLRAPDPAAVRTVSQDTIASPGDDPGLVRDGIRERSGRHGAPDTGAKEHWDYCGLEAGWREERRYFLAGRGITWNPEAGTVTMPAGMTDEEAGGAWRQAADRFGRWIDGVIEEVWKGRTWATSHNVRRDTAPGARWVGYEPGKKWDDPGELAAALADAGRSFQVQPPPLNRNPADSTTAVLTMGYGQLMAAGAEAGRFPSVHPGGAGAVVREAVAAVWAQLVPEAVAHALVVSARMITGRGDGTGILDDWDSCPAAAMMLASATAWKTGAPEQAGWPAPEDVAASLTADPAHNAAVMHGTYVLLALAHEHAGDDLDGTVAAGDYRDDTCEECGGDLQGKGTYGCECWNPAACDECGDQGGNCDCAYL